MQALPLYTTLSEDRRGAIFVKSISYTDGTLDYVVNLYMQINPSLNAGFASLVCIMMVLVLTATYEGYQLTLLKHFGILS